MALDLHDAALSCSTEAMDGTKKLKSKVVAPRNPKLLRGIQPEIKLCPSVYLTQMSMDTEEWLANQQTMKLPTKIELLDMSETTNQRVSNISIDEPLFQPYPSEIFFQRFKPFETHEVPLVLRNNDKIPRLLKVVQEPSPYFRLISPANSCHKVGPGLPTIYKVQFIPESNQDYTHELVCITEREKFIIPVRAIGPRAVLDFPDVIDFHHGLVKHSNSKTLLIRNVGTRDGKFQLATEKPFAVNPVSSVIPVDGMLQVSVEFQPVTVGEHVGELIVHYDTGEDVYVQLHGVAENAQVRLEKNTIRIEKTFISLSNQRLVTISNHSDVIAHFRWSRFATQEEEDQQKILLKAALVDSEMSETDRFLQECNVDPTIADKISIIRRSYQNRQTLIEDDPMLFLDDVIKIDPIEGDIWPRSSTEVTVIFQPDVAKDYNRIAFCDVTGREARLSLKVQAEGIGPNVHFTFDSVDMGNIYVFSTHTYEIVLANKGDIDAMFSLLPSNSSCRPCFQLNPAEGIIMPGGFQAIQVLFSSRIVGNFMEEFCFQVDGLSDPVTVVFVGNIIAPTFSFDVPKLKFGTVSYGFPSTKSCILHNTSLIPMTFYLRIPSDGNGAAVSCLNNEADDSRSSDSRLSFTDPKEFEIIPSGGVLPPKSEMEIKVSLCSNTRKHYDTVMVVDVEGVGLELFSLPITAKCTVPSVVITSPCLTMGHCFIGHPYNLAVELSNSSDLPAKYCLIPCAEDGLESLSYSSTEPQGVIEPHSTLDVSLTVAARDIGNLEATVHFRLVGNVEMTLPLQVMCIGEGPVVHVTPPSLNWNQVPVLTEISKVVTVSNESLIPAHFTTEMVQSGSVWRVEPFSGVIEPEEVIELLVTAFLDDNVIFSNKLKINIKDGPSHSVELSATGHGTTIVYDPPISNTFNLGPHFSKSGCHRTFTLVNRGRRHHSIVWHTDGFPILTRTKRPQRAALGNSRDMKYKDIPPPLGPIGPVFTIKPQRLELNPGDTAEVTLEGNVDSPQIVKETLLCNAIIGRSGGKELIKTVKVICEFINPLVEFSTDTVSFSVSKAPDDELSILTNSLELTNVSSLPLTIHLSLNFPFFFAHHGQEKDTEKNGVVRFQEILLDVGEKHEVDIQFEPAYIDDLHSRTIDDILTVTYLEHPNVDEVKLHGEIFFPNLQCDKMEIDFGCILNDTEATRYMTIVNNSPLEVKYRWSFILDNDTVTVFKKPVAFEDSSDEHEVGKLHEQMSEKLVDNKQFVEQLDVTIEAGSSDNEVEMEEKIHQTTPNKELEINSENEDGEEKKDLEKPPNSPKISDHDTSCFENPTYSREPSQVTLGKILPVINPNLAAILRNDNDMPSIPSVGEIFDILPIYGTLQPGEEQLITLTFYGHAHFGSNAKAICEVIGGPEYEIILKGEASLIDYKFDYLEIDCSKVMYDQVATSQITLTNTGHVGFEFVAINMDPALAEHPKPGFPVMIPHRGYVEPHGVQILAIKYLPEGPRKFHASFQVQVAHFEPDVVNIYGEGVFPRLTLDLPRVKDSDDIFESLLFKAKENLIQEFDKKTNRPSSGVSEVEALSSGQIQMKSVPSEIEIQMEMERLVIQEFVDQQLISSGKPNVLLVHGEPRPPSFGQTSTKKLRKTGTKPRPLLPDYLLDFGHVVLGSVYKRTVNVTNTGWFHASFSVDRKSLALLKQSGFLVEMPKVVQLPGAPDHETISFEVTFDPCGANLGVGLIEVCMPINIVGGPQVNLRLKATVTIPDMQVSTDIIDFGNVKCGDCCFVTIQLHNHQEVRCDWSFAPPAEKERKQTNKHLPLHMRRKTCPAEKAVPLVFEIIPSTGALLPGQHQNVQVKFMPREKKLYETSVGVKLSQSSKRIVIRCSGQGQEPTIEMDKQLLEFGPILPHSSGDEKEIVLKNPCNFPIEIYSLEFDKVYLEEEKVLRFIKGYDEYGTLLLPPRHPGEKLPQEILDYYEDQMRKLEEAELMRREREIAESTEPVIHESVIAEDPLGENNCTDTTKTAEKVAEVCEQRAPSKSVKEKSISLPLIQVDKSGDVDILNIEQGDVSKKSTVVGSVGELEVTPVSAAIARHLGIDISDEGTAARNRRGIAIVVHGAPKSGKTSIATTLAKTYNAALLNIDAVIIKAIEAGRLPAGQRARELCLESANQAIESQRLLVELEEGEKKTSGGNLSVEAVMAHAQGAAGLNATPHAAPQITASNRKTSTISDNKTSKTDRHHGFGPGARGVLASSGDGTSLQAGSPCPTSGPIVRRLSISCGEDELWSTVLPDDLVVSILAERLMMKDCHLGVVFDGVESLFTANILSSVQSILKAINNRKYIFAVGLKLDYSVIKEKEKEMEAEKERLQRQKEEEEKCHLEEMSEDEYDALSEEEKARIEKKRLEIKRERMKRERAEQLERRQREEKEKMEAELRRQEEEKARKKGGRRTQPLGTKDGKKTTAVPGKQSEVKNHPKLERRRSHEGDHTVTKPENRSDASNEKQERGDSAMDDAKRKKEKHQKTTGEGHERGKGKGKDSDKDADTDHEEPIKQPSEAELLLIQRFRAVERYSKDISYLFEWWERACGMLHPVTPSEGDGMDGSDDAPPTQGGKKQKKSTGQHDKQSRMEKEKNRESKETQQVLEQGDLGSDGNQDQLTSAEEEKQERRLLEGIGIPHIIVNCNHSDRNPLATVLNSKRLPSPEDVIEGLGLGSKGPPIPPPATFSVIPYPIKRQPPVGAETSHYRFISTPSDDANQEEKPSEAESEQDKTADDRKDHPPLSRLSRRGLEKPGRLEKEKSAERRKKSSKTRTGRRSSVITLTPPLGVIAPASENDTRQFRWIIPAEGEITLKLLFTSEELGQFDHTFNFEIVGTRRRYQLYCRGVCAFPTISREPRYLEERFPENLEKFTILNSSPMEAEVSFCFLNDNKAETFLLEPQIMTLKPAEQQVLRVWAYPKHAVTYEDSVVCCIKENPEPVIFKLLCHGTRPELEVDKKVLHFDKVLLHRKDMKTLCLKNNTLLPVAWRLNGLDNLGDDFSVSMEHGVIPPKTDITLDFYFKAIKPINTSKKSIRIEVSDVDNILGLVQTETVQIHAEAYDVALDMSFPKGADGGIDFDIVRIPEEAKQICTLKNKGKYDISFSFKFEPTPECPPELCKLFSINPEKPHVLTPTDRPVSIQIVFHSKKEVVINEQPILRCQIIEPNIGEGGEVIASIPIKISVKSVFIKYNINPVNDLNFGALLVNSKKTRTFMIENIGEKFDMKYMITRVIKAETRATNQPETKQGKGKRSELLSKAPDESFSSKTGARSKKNESVRADPAGGSQSRLILGMFTVFPAIGSVPPSGQQVVQVECLAESQGKCEEDVTIDIIGRDPRDNPGGIPYRLIAEACIPSINIDDIGAIFEEHRICKNLSTTAGINGLQSAGGIYGEKDRKFLFSNVLVGSKVKSRFKISNIKKVPCDVAFSIKPVAAKGSKQIIEAFEVSPNRVSIPPHGHVYATVSFCPAVMQQYNALFEAYIETVPQNQPKGRALIFELSGEGNLPHVLITKPVVRNRKGQPLLLFKRNLVGQTQALPVAITNDGTLACKVDLELTDPDEVFAILCNDSNKNQGNNSHRGGLKKVRTTSVILDVGEKALLEVSFHAHLPQRSQGQLRLAVVNNQYEETVIQLVAEGYQENITIDNVQSSPSELEMEMEEGNLADDDVPAAKCNHMRFGNCFIGESKTLTCTLANHSAVDSFRFVWPDHPQLKFSPRIGHLLPSHSKDISVSFKTDQPVKFNEFEIQCTLNAITFDHSVATTDLSEWDDRLKTVKWIDVSSTDRGLKSETQQPPTSASLPAKRKVVEIEPEPEHTELPNATSAVSLFVSANGGFCRYKLEEGNLHFRDTLMFQTRVHQLQLQNTGTVPLEFNWMVVMDDFTRSRHSGMDDQSTVVDVETSRPATAGPLLVNSENVRPSSVDSYLIAGFPYTPFSITPENGTVASGKSLSLCIKFSPLDVNDYEARLICSIPNLEPGAHGPVIGVRARSLMPYCHFELEDSDYLRNARRNPELPGPGGLPAGTTLDPNTRVIEFRTVGVGVKYRKQFSIINPTNQNYTYQWTCKDLPNSKKIPEFTCLTAHGSISSGKKSDILFEFVSSSLNLVESFWKFEIPEQNIVLPFLLVGQANDPSIAFDQSHLNFRCVLIGHKSVEMVTMTNDESEAFEFSFDEASCQLTSFAAQLVIKPKQGTIQPKSRLPVEIHFSPKLEKEVNFNIICNVKRKTLPLALNVKAEGFSMNSLVLCEDSLGIKKEMSSTSTNTINFGCVEINEKAVRNISIVNLGKFSFDYAWELKDQASSTVSSPHGTVSISPQSGGIGQGENVSCLLSFLPPRMMTLKNCELLLRVAHGPTYAMQLQGVGILPGIHFSFVSYNFGASFVYHPGMPAHSTILKLTNNDSKNISVECISAPNLWLHHNFEAVVIAPHQSHDVTFTFYPREPIRYKETVTFEINGLSQQAVEFMGQGAEMKIEVADARQKVVKYGALRVGSTLKKVVSIVNNSLAPVTFRLSLNPTSAALQESGVVKFIPTEDITLQPKGGTTKVEVTISPKTRITQFTEEVQLECAGVHQTLFIITGSCQGMEIALNADSVPFGAVVLKSSSIRQLVLTNSGDIGARFKWDVSHLGPHFSISPTDGYISSGMEVMFDVVFHPQEISADIRNDNLTCQIEGGNPLKLILTGTCVGIPPMKEIYHFSTSVRQKETRNLQLANHTNLAWNLRPIIDGEQWRGPEVIHVPPQTTKMYELTYHPLTMTLEGKKHTGSIFFPLPDGTGLMFNLSGIGEPPKPNEKINRDVPCKTTYTEMLRVQNWLKKPQRFRAKIENVRSDKFDQSLTIKGLDYIDVPGLSTKDYKLIFHALKECQPQIKVTFTNEQTAEYQYFELYFRTIRPGVISSIQLSTPIRQSKQHTLMLENPLNNAVTFSASCNIPEIQIPSQLSVPAQSEGAFTFEFFPLKVGTMQGKLEFSSNDLGLYIYDLEAKATPAGPERALHFKTCLGTSQTLYAKFLNYTKHKTDYTCKVDHSDYHVDKSIAATSAPISGTEVSVEVTYEPSCVGESKANLTVSSPLGGDYSFPIFGVCTLPKPQGPFTIKSGSSVNITFRNVFGQTTAYTFQVDNPLFHVAKPSENIRAHKEYRIIVGFDGNDGPSKAPVMGKLTVSCAHSAGSTGATQWVYYLKGVTPEGK